MKNKIYFSVPVYTELNSTFPMTEDYNFWVPLLNYFLKKSNRIEIHCWNEEESTIRELEDKLEISLEYNMTIFCGALTEELKNLLLTQYEDKNGRLKWFSVFLRNEDSQVLSSEHWATEFFASNVSQEDVLFIKSLLPSETTYHQY